MQKVLCCLCSFLLYGFSSVTLAQGNWFASVGVGASFLNVDSNNYISSGLGWPNDRYHNTSVDVAGLFVFEGGYQWSRNNLWLPYYSLSLNYTYGIPTAVNGKVEQYSLPAFTNYNYQYDIQTQTFLMQVKADLYRWRCWMPFLLVGAGLTLNNAGDYTEQAVPGVTPRVSPGFGSQTNSYFAYVLGAGLDYTATRNTWVSLMYLYSNLGNAPTGTGANTVVLTDTNYSNQKLKTKLRENSVIVKVTYLFDPA